MGLFKRTRKVVRKWRLSSRYRTSRSPSLPTSSAAKNEAGASTGEEKAEEEQSEKKVMFSFFLDLPTEMQSAILVFLHPQEAVRISLTCKSMQAAFPYRILKPPFRILRSLSSRIDPNSRNYPLRATVINLPSVDIPLRKYDESIHSFLIKCSWYGCLWGDFSVKLYVVAHYHSDNEMTFWGGRILVKCSSKVRKDNPHIADMQACFRPKWNERYSLWICANTSYASGRLVGHGVLKTYCLVSNTAMA